MTAPASMIEKVARAISRENGDDFDTIPKNRQDWINERGQFGGRFRDINEPKQADYLDMARAALDAAAEPTQAMLNAANDELTRVMLDAVNEFPCAPSSRHFARIYRAMIAAAAED